MDAQLTREESVLVKLCHRRFGEEPTSSVELPDGPLGNEFLDLAARHRVYGLTISSLLRHPEMLSPSTRDEIAGIATGLRRRAAAMELERDRILAMLEEVGVRTVVLKGAALLQTVYSRSFERDLQDIDLLVPEKSLATAVRALTEGKYNDPPPGSWSLYRRHHFHIALTRPSGARVEVHWALTRKAGWFQLDPVAVLRDAVEVESPEALLVVPTPEHMILHLVIQSINESFGFLARFVDIDRIVAQVPELDWDGLVRTARSGGMEIPTALSLQLTRGLFDTEIPLEVLDDLRPGRIVRFHLEAMDPVAALMSQRLVGGPTKYRLLRFWLTSGAWRRVRLLLTMLVPSNYDHFEEFRSGQPGLIDRIARLAKLVVLESSLLAQRTLSKLGLRKDAQTRFWSSHASSSERR
jgi:hypothetical protein